MNSAVYKTAVCDLSHGRYSYTATNQYELIKIVGDELETAAEELISGCNTESN